MNVVTFWKLLQIILTMQKNKLKEMKNHKQREESIQMDIKSISPFHILSPGWSCDHVSICYKPKENQNKMKNDKTSPEAPTTMDRGTGVQDSTISSWHISTIYTLSVRWTAKGNMDNLGITFLKIPQKFVLQVLLRMTKSNK